MSKREKYENRLMQAVILLLGLTLLSLWMLSNMYAKYASQGSGFDSGRVAQFHVSSENNMKETYQLNPEMTDQDLQKVTVLITNDSEVAVKYTFKFESEGNLPLAVTGQAPGGLLLAQSESGDQFTIQKAAGEELSEVYTFTIAIKNTEESYQYAGGVGSIKMTVTAEQID